MNEINIQTYKQAAEAWFAKESAKPEHRGMMPSPVMLYDWAAHLDKGHLDIHMQLIAVMAAREVDRKVLHELVEIVGLEKAQEIIKRIAGTALRPKGDDETGQSVPA